MYGFLEWLEKFKVERLMFFVCSKSYSCKQSVGLNTEVCLSLVNINDGFV
jgi:hypothetical protein